MVPWPAWAAGKINGPTEAAARVNRSNKPVLIVFMGAVNRRSHIHRVEGVSTEDSLFQRKTLLVGRHLGQALKLLVQHARDHVDFLVVELLQRRGWFVVAERGLAVLAFRNENTDGNIEAHTMILLE